MLLRDAIYSAPMEPMDMAARRQQEAAQAAVEMAARLGA